MKLVSGYVVMIVVESLYGRSLPDSRTVIIVYIGSLLVLIWLARFIVADVLWLMSASW
jgi:hypothetical protein